MTHRGRWALRLSLSGCALVALSVAVVAFADAHVFGPVGFGGLLLLVAAGVLAALAAIRDHERSPLVAVTVVPALFGLFLVIGELAFPH